MKKLFTMCFAAMLVLVFLTNANAVYLSSYDRITYSFDFSDDFYSPPYDSCHFIVEYDTYEWTMIDLYPYDSEGILNVYGTREFAEPGEDQFWSDTIDVFTIGGPAFLSYDTEFQLEINVANLPHPSSDEIIINIENVWLSMMRDDPYGSGLTVQTAIVEGTPFTAPVPEPSTMVLMGLGLAGLAGFGRKKFKK